MLSIPLTAQTTLNENTGKVETTPERIKNAARIMKDWVRLDSVVKQRERQLKQAQELVDSLRVQLAVQKELNLIYLQQRDAQDERINELANQEIDIWKGLSKGLHLDSGASIQLYDLSNAPVRVPAVLNTSLTYSWSRYRIGLGAIAVINENLQTSASGVLVLGFRWF